jgi:hypothetical protein
VYYKIHPALATASRSLSNVAESRVDEGKFDKMGTIAAIIAVMKQMIRK